MRNLFWMIVGAGLAVFLVLRGRELLQRLTPQGISQQVERKGQETAANLGDFVGTFRAAMAQREGELRQELNLPAKND